MSHTRKRPRRTLVRLLAFFVGGALVGVLSSTPRRTHDEDVPAVLVPEPATAPPAYAAPARVRRGFGARLAFACLFTAIFVGGAAFTAFGGDQVAQIVDGTSTDAAATTTDTAAASPTDATTTAADTTPAAPAEGTSDPTATDAAPAPAPVTDTAAAAAPVEPTTTDATDTTAAATPAPAPQTTADNPADAPVVDAQTVGGSKHVVHHVASSSRATANGNSALAAPVVTVDARAAERRLQRRLAAQKQKAAPPDPETSTPSTASIVWLNRAQVDPTPPSKRLLRSFGRMLVHTSSAWGAQWPLVLGILRAEGATGRVPATAQTVSDLAKRVAELHQQGRDDWQSAADITGDPSLADRALALSHYDHAVGIETLISGLEAAKKRLSKRLLDDPAVTIYPGGRDDIEAGRIDSRVLAAIAYLRDTFGSVEVTSLISGHRLYARPRVLSAHVFGLAVDVAALGGVPIVGHQQPGGLTEQAVRALLFLPAEDMPKQIISLLSLGGPSFALPDHYDHIHVGY